jgi:hypothetical protein
VKRHYRSLPSRRTKRKTEVPIGIADQRMETLAANQMFEAKRLRINENRTVRLEIASIVVAFLTAITAGAGVWMANRQADATDAQLNEMRRSGSQSEVATLRLVEASESQAAALKNQSNNLDSQNNILEKSISQSRNQTNEMKRQADLVAKSISVSRDMAQITTRLLKSNQKSVELYTENTILNNRPIIAINIEKIIQDPLSKKWKAETKITNIGRSQTDYAFISGRVLSANVETNHTELDDCEQESISCNSHFLVLEKI